MKPIKKVELLKPKRERVWPLGDHPEKRLTSYCICMLWSWCLVSKKVTVCGASVDQRVLGFMLSFTRGFSPFILRALASRVQTPLAVSVRRTQILEQSFRASLGVQADFQRESLRRLG